MDYIANSMDLLREDDSFIKKMLIGGGVLMASILILPYFFYQGYLMKILRETEQGLLEDLPEWDDWGKLFIDGLISFFFSLLIAIPVYIVIFVPLLVLGENSSVGVLLQLVGNVLSFVTGYVTIALLAILMRDGHEELTDFNRIKQILLSKEYIIAYLIITAIGIGFGMFTLFFIIFTIGLGLIVLPFIYFILQSIVIYILGRAITEADPTIEEYRTLAEDPMGSHVDEKYRKVTDSTLEEDSEE